MDDCYKDEEDETFGCRQGRRHITKEDVDELLERLRANKNRKSKLIVAYELVVAKGKAGVKAVDLFGVI